MKDVILYLYANMHTSDNFEYSPIWKHANVKPLLKKPGRCIAIPFLRFLSYLKFLAKKNGCVFFLSILKAEDSFWEIPLMVLVYQKQRQLLEDWQMTSSVLRMLVNESSFFSNSLPLFTLSSTRFSEITCTLGGISGSVLDWLYSHFKQKVHCSHHLQVWPQTHWHRANLEVIHKKTVAQAMVHTSVPRICPISCARK